MWILDLIEEGKFLKIPKHVSRLGFVKSYAKYLEVDISRIIRNRLIDTIGLKNEGEKIILYRGFKSLLLFCFLTLLLTVLFFN